MFVSVSDLDMNLSLLRNFTCTPPSQKVLIWGGGGFLGHFFGGSEGLFWGIFLTWNIFRKFSFQKAKIYLNLSVARPFVDGYRLFVDFTASTRPSFGCMWPHSPPHKIIKICNCPTPLAKNGNRKWGRKEEVAKRREHTFSGISIAKKSCKTWFTVRNGPFTFKNWVGKKRLKLFTH